MGEAITAERRTHRQVGALSLALLGWYGPLFIPRGDTACADPCEALRVMQFNTGQEVLAPEDLLAPLRESGADIITLQEVTADQADAIQAELDIFHRRCLSH